MNDRDLDLMELMNELASHDPQRAPQGLEDRLKLAFRRHRRRRKFIAWAPVAAVAAVAGIAFMVWHPENTVKLASAKSAVVAHAGAAVEDDSGFYPLAAAEALPPIEDGMVVRVQLPASSLRLMGVPVGEERSEVSVLAELLLGQDGLARAVRLVE